MSDVFISYARSTAPQAQQIAEALRALGYGVWRDDDLPPHRPYSEVIEERLRSAKAVVVIWSAEAVKSHWVQSEADLARQGGKLVQLSLDPIRLPMPFDRVQCEDMSGWTGDLDAAGWRKVAASVGDMVGEPKAPPAGLPEAHLPLPSKPSIAVMPFANLSGDPEEDYFADGMVEEIVTVLTRFKSIFVIGSGSTLSFKGKAVSPQDVGRRLGVRYVLDGSVREAGGRVRISVRLSDAADGAQVWSERFEDTLRDVFALQDRVALSVAGQLEPTVQVAEIRRASARPTESLGSYQLYLRAWALERTFVKANVLQALDLLYRAISLDPDFAPALALAAICHRVIFNFRWSDDPESDRRQGVELAHRALKNTADDATVLANVASVLGFLERDQDATLALLDRALALNPGSSFVWFYSGVSRLQVGQTELGVEQLETALRLDPMGPSRPNLLGFLGHGRFQQRRFAEAVPLLRELVQQTDSPRGYAFLAASFGHLGQRDAARQALERYRTLTPQPIEAIGRTFMDDPGHIRLFMDGVALAEDKSPSGP